MSFFGKCRKSSDRTLSYIIFFLKNVWHVNIDKNSWEKRVYVSGMRKEGKAEKHSRERYSENWK